MPKVAYIRFIRFIRGGASQTARVVGLYKLAHGGHKRLDRKSVLADR